MRFLFDLLYYSSFLQFTKMPLASVLAACCCQGHKNAAQASYLNSTSVLLDTGCGGIGGGGGGAAAAAACDRRDKVHHKKHTAQNKNKNKNKTPTHLLLLLLLLLELGVGLFLLVLLGSPGFLRKFLGLLQGVGHQDLVEDRASGHLTTQCTMISDGGGGYYSKSMQSDIGGRGCTKSMLSVSGPPSGSRSPRSRRRWCQRSLNNPMHNDIGGGGGGKQNEGLISIFR